MLVKKIDKLFFLEVFSCLMKRTVLSHLLNPSESGDSPVLEGPTIGKEMTNSLNALLLLALVIYKIYLFFSDDTNSICYVCKNFF